VHFVSVQKVILMLNQDLSDPLVIFVQEIVNNIIVLFNLGCILTDYFKQGVLGVCLSNFRVVNMVFECVKDYKALVKANLHSMACLISKPCFILLTSLDGLSLLLC
jgi:hypothetical protein